MIQMIKGTDITLYTNGMAETVSNVLVGEPSENGKIYTLAIPKGDAHSWTDRLVEIFGTKFRTIGFAEQGIEENIPLAWHKKVKVERLITNAICTLYEKDSFKRHIFYDVYTHDARGEVVTKDGAKTSGDVKMLIYAVCNNSGYVPKIGDIILDFECDFEFDSSSQQSVSESMAQFRKSCPEFAVIKSVEHKTIGIKPDFDITAR